MVILANKGNQTDGSAYNLLSRIDCKLPIVLVTRVGNFVFNDELKNIGDYILVDFVELGWDFNYNESHVFGRNTNTIFKSIFVGDEWKALDEFIVEKPPAAMFVRELLKADISDNLYPIEYPCWYNPPSPQSKIDYCKRKISVFYNWGYSHEARRVLHGNMWINAPKYGYIVCDNINNIESFLSEEDNPRKWVSVNCPHYARYSMDVILGINGESKVSVSMPGAGKKCFRQMESSINSLVAMSNDGLAWSFNWDDGNSIQFDIGNEIDKIFNTLEHEDVLYSKYVGSVENCRKYFLPNYIKHLEGIINKV